MIYLIIYMSRDGVVEVKYNQNMFFYENTDYCNDKHDKKKFFDKIYNKNINIFIFHVSSSHVISIYVVIAKRMTSSY